MQNLNVHLELKSRLATMTLTFLAISATVFGPTSAHAQAAQMLPHDQYNHSPRLLREGAQIAIQNSTESSPKVEADGPAISRLVGISSEPIFKLIRHPRAKAGQKVVVIELPKNAKGETKIDGMQVAIKFTVIRETDSCNYYSIQGQVVERKVPDAEFLGYFEMNSKLGSMSTTLMGCMNDSHRTRPVEITTNLQDLRRFRDNLVFYVPEEVSVEAQIWQPTDKVTGTVVP